MTNDVKDLLKATAMGGASALGSIIVKETVRALKSPVIKVIIKKVIIKH